MYFYRPIVIDEETSQGKLYSISLVTGYRWFKVKSAHTVATGGGMDRVLKTRSSFHQQQVCLNVFKLNNRTNSKLLDLDVYYACTEDTYFCSLTKKHG